MKFLTTILFCSLGLLSFSQFEKLEEQKLNVDTLFFSDPKEALVISEKQLPKALESKDTFYITYFLDQAGELNRFEGNYDRAIKLLNECLVYKENWEDLKDLSLTHNNLGRAYGQKGMYELAVFHFLEALKLMEKTGNLLGQSFYLNNLGAMYDSQKNYNMSLDYYSKALKIKRELKNDKAIAASLTNLGIIYYHLGDHEKALVNLREAYDIYRKGDVPEKWVRVISNIGEIYIAKGDSQKALEYYEEATKMDSSINDQRLRIKIIANYGHSLLLENRYELADAKFQNALSLAEESKSYASLAYVYNLRSKLARLLGEEKSDAKQLAKALEYSDMSIAYNDSMINKENIRSIAEMQAKYEYEKNKRMINEGKLLIAEKEQKIQKNRASAFLWIGISVALFLFVVIGFSLYYAKQRKNLLMKGQIALIENQKTKLEQLNQNVKEQLGKTVITLKEKEELLENVFTKSKDKELPEELLKLSKRETEVLSYLALGWSDDMLAEKLFVSKSTIKTHLRRIYSKLLVKGRAEAVAIAHRYKLIGDQVYS